MQDYLAIYKKMVLIRCVEEKICEEYPNQDIRTPVHLYIGEEAVAASISVLLRDSDYVISNHRSHGHCLAKGMELEPFFLELYGKKGGCCEGYGGSMHLKDDKRGIIGSSAIVAGGLPISAGVAYKQILDGNDDVTVVYFGDGAVDEGVFYETINFASFKKLPLLFVMEDNNYASQTSKEQRHSYKSIAPIISGFNIETYDVDGNKADEIYSVAKNVIDKIRKGEGPKFISAYTYRWMGHVGVSDDSHTGYRSVDESMAWRNKCPLEHMKKMILNTYGDGAKKTLKAIYEDARCEVDRAVNVAKEAVYALD